MRIPSGKTDQVIYFVALDANDMVTRKTGLSSFTVYRSRNGGAATAYTTPTVAELSSANMPGVYSLLIDEDTTIASGSDSEEYCVHITQASMAPLTRALELYRRDTTTGNTALVDSNGRVDVIKLAGQTVTAAAGVTFPTSVASPTNITAGTITTVTTLTGLTASDVGAIKTKTDSLTFTVAGQVDANIQYVNDTAIQGTGAVGTDEWRKV